MLEILVMHCGKKKEINMNVLIYTYCRDFFTTTSTHCIPDYFNKLVDVLLVLVGK